MDDTTARGRTRTPTPTPTRRWGLHGAASLVAIGAMGAAWACSSPTANTLKGAGQAAAPPSGPAYFDPDIQASMDALGCSAGGCHGAADNPMHVVPPASGGSVDVNYKNVLPRTAGGAASLLLTKPVDGSGVQHDGGKLIATTDPLYKQWLDWIQRGAPFRAAGGAPLQDVDAAAPPAMPDAAPTVPPPPPPMIADGGAQPDAAVACVPPTIPMKSSHNRGQECRECHVDIANPALQWTIAGTLFDSPYGTSAHAGASIVVVDSAAQTLTLTTDVEGNFYTTQPVRFPVTVRASACPSTMAMSGMPTAGGCNSTSCHDSSRPMYLP